MFREPRSRREVFFGKSHRVTTLMLRLFFCRRTSPPTGIPNSSYAPVLVKHLVPRGAVFARYEVPGTQGFYTLCKLMEVIPKGEANAKVCFVLSTSCVSSKGGRCLTYPTPSPPRPPPFPYCTTDNACIWHYLLFDLVKLFRWWERAPWGYYDSAEKFWIRRKPQVSTSWCRFFTSSPRPR